MPNLERLDVFVPTNRVSRNGRRLGMDGLNDIVRMSRGNKYAAAKRKDENEAWIAARVSEAMRDSGWVAWDGLTTVILRFVEPDMRRDDDNVFAGAKFFLDALCMPGLSGGRVVHKNGCSAVKDDDPAHVCLVTRRAPVDRLNPGVWVSLIRRR